MALTPLSTPSRFAVGGNYHARGRNDLGIITPPASRFAGDLGPGKLYHGCSLNLGVTSISAFEASTGVQLGLYRRYYQSTDIASFQADATSDVAADRLTWASFKLPGTWAQMAAGAFDSWFVDFANACEAVPGPTWTCWHHEPRGEGQPASDYVAMYEHGIPIVKGITGKTAIGPILNGYSFAPGGDPDPHIWFVPSADMVNFDQYNQWWSYDHLTVGPNGTAESYHPWQNPSYVLGPAVTIQESWGKPSACAEYGTHHAWLEPNKSKQWMADAFQYAVDHSLPGLCYFNSGLNSPRGPWDMDKYMKPADYNLYTDNTDRLDQFKLNAARAEVGTLAEAL